MKHTKTEICSTGVGIGQNQKTWLRFTFFHFEDVCRKVSYLILPRPPPFFFSFWLHHMACGILVPQLEIELKPLASIVQSPNHWITREFCPTYLISLGLSFFIFLKEIIVCM